MMGLRLVFRGDDLLSCHPSLHGHYPLRRYYDDSDFCQPPRDVPALADLLCSRHHPCLTYDHQPPQHSPAQVPYLHALVRRLTRRGFAFHSQARRFALAESCSLSLSSVRFFSLLSTPPRGDAVTSSSHPEHGSRWPGSFTPKDRDASQRTSADLRVRSTPQTGIAPQCPPVVLACSAPKPRVLAALSVKRRPLSESDPLRARRPALQGRFGARCHIRYCL